MNFTILILLAVVAVVIAWNVYPPLRSKMRGLSTIVEAVVGMVTTYFVMFADALKEAQDAGYVPENIAVYVPAIMCVYIVIKRVQTKTPVGGKD